MYYSDGSDDIWYERIAAVIVFERPNSANTHGPRHLYKNELVLMFRHQYERVSYDRIVFEDGDYMLADRTTRFICLLDAIQSILIRRNIRGGLMRCADALPKQRNEEWRDVPHGLIAYSPLGCLVPFLKVAD